MGPHANTSAVICALRAASLFSRELCDPDAQSKLDLDDAIRQMKPIAAAAA